MAMKTPLLRFWKALDEIPEAATDRREWAQRLGDDWLVAAAYLKSTGRLVREVACPSPGGEGCPRKVIRHPDGRLRAVCGARPGECDPLDLTLEDVTCLALDRAKLAVAVAAILDAGEEAGQQSDGTAVVVGSHAVAAGVAIPVVLAIPGPMAAASPAMPFGLSRETGPVAVVVPTARSISPDLRATLTSQGHLVLFLSEIATVRDHRLAAVHPAAELLAPLRKQSLASLSPTASARLWVLPPGTRWEDLTFDFISNEVINVRSGPETRRFEPEHFGMKSKKNGRPTDAWTILLSIARRGGSLTWKDPEASGSIKAQKHLLSRRLRTLFGIADDPIVWRPKQGLYQARFTIRDSRPDRTPARRAVW
jgi:hypothetical protein